MTSEKQLGRTLSENCLTLLCFDNEHGKIIANQVKPELFEGDYRTIAERAIDYWRQHQCAPGAAHTADLVADIMDDPTNKRAPTFRRAIAAMMELAPNINTAYVMTQLTTFIRMQKFKSAILSSAEKLNTAQEIAVPEIEQIWNDLLKVRELNFEPGMRLTDWPRMLDHFEQRAIEFKTGIRELDMRGIVPARKEVLLFLAPPKRGKSHWLVNIAKQALILRKKVAFVSLEMSEEQILQRMIQSLWSVGKHTDDENPVLRFDADSMGKLTGFEEDDLCPEFTFDSPDVKLELDMRMEVFGTRFSDNLIIKRFAPRSIDMRGIASYLDNLEMAAGFIPDMLIVDYMGRTKTDLKNHRLNLGAEFEDFRGLCVERNMAGATAHQTHRDGARAVAVQSTHISEDYSFIMTADNVISYSATEQERKLGLARLRVTEARSEAGEFGVLISQNYRTCQFSLSSMLLPSKYWDKLKEHTGDDDDESTDD